jgi:hypothetical protein
MGAVKSVKQPKKRKTEKAISRPTKRRVRIAGGTGRIPREILDTPGPACPGAVDILIADRNR